MVAFFNPGIILMNRLKYVRKFALISIMFALPLGFVTMLLMLQLHADIATAQKEQSGAAYLRPLHGLLSHTLTTRMLSNEYLHGEEDVAEQLLRSQLQVDQDFEALHAIDQRLGGELGTTERLNALATSWRSLKTRVFNLRSYQSDDLHTQLIADIRGLMALVGDSADLVLDPSIESHYTSDMVLQRLPEGQDLIAQTQLLGDLAIENKGLTAGDRMQLSILNGLVEAHIRTTSRGLGVAYHDNPGVKASLEAPLREYSAATDALLLMLRKDIIFAAPISVPSHLYMAAADQAIAANLALWDRSSDVLDELLNARIARLTRQKYLVVAVAAAGLLLVAYLWMAFYLAVVRTVSRLDEAAQRMVSGALVDTVQLDNRDELGQIARSFNDIATALIAAGTYRQAVLDNAVDGIMTMDEQGLIRSFNPAAGRIFGYAATEALGQPIEQFIPAPHSHEYRVVGVGREVRGRRKDGSSFPLDLAVGQMDQGDQHVFIGIIHDLTERKRTEVERAQLQEQIIQVQATTLAALSTPLIPISDQVVVMPLIGSVDSQRARQVLAALLQGVEHSQARVAILDITGVPVVDTHVAQALISVAQGVRLLGAQFVLTGIRPEVAQTIVGMGADLSRIVTHSTLQSGIAYATSRRQA